MLVRKDGKVGWEIFQEAIVGTYAETFDDFILMFSEHRKLAWPFDPYGAPQAGESDADDQED